MRGALHHTTASIGLCFGDLMLLGKIEIAYVIYDYEMNISSLMMHGAANSLATNWNIPIQRSAFRLWKKNQTIYVRSRSRRLVIEHGWTDETFSIPWEEEDRPTDRQLLEKEILTRLGLRTHRDPHQVAGLINKRKVLVHMHLKDIPFAGNCQPSNLDLNSF